MSTRYLKVENGTLSYDDQGSGQLVICAPSIGDVRAEYRFLTPRLVEAGYRVVTMDLRGLGESSVGWSEYTVGAVGSDMLALIKHLQAGPALIIGDSMAAGAAVCAAADGPELVSGLVLIGPFVRVMMPKVLSVVMAQVVAGQLWGAAFWTKYYSTLYPTNKPADFAEYLDHLKKNLKEKGRLKALRGMLSDTKAASEARLAKVKVPTHLVMGSKDPDFKQPAQEVQTIKERLTSTKATIQMIEGAGHYPHAEMPEQTAATILEFFSTFKGKVSHGS